MGLVMTMRSKPLPLSFHINFVKIKFRPHSLFVILNHAHPNNLVTMMVIKSVVLTPGLIKTLEIKRLV